MMNAVPRNLNEALTLLITGAAAAAWLLLFFAR